jgi:16S rRNA (uracil1498-N3)-methyltransferase
MTNRYFSEQPIECERASIRGPEARHMTKVMRQNVGDRVVLFDGRGAEFTAEIAAIQRDDVSLRIVARYDVERELPFELVLAVALPKGDRQVWLVQKLVELGVTQLIPLHTRRGVAQVGNATIERIRRQVIEAAKQCGRNRLMEIGQSVTLNELSDLLPSTMHRIFADPRGGDRLTHGSADTCFAIGPEGGFTDDELLTAEQLDWRIVSLGDRIVRVETAAIALAAWRSLACVASY